MHPSPQPTETSKAPAARRLRRPKRFSMPKHPGQIKLKKLRTLLPALLLIALAPWAAPPVEARTGVRETPVVKAVRRASPAVVNISSEQAGSGGSPFSGLGMDPHFESFFRDFFSSLLELRRDGSQH